MNSPRFRAADLASLTDPAGQTEAAIASRLVRLHGDRLRWCDPWGKWLVWDGRRWAMDSVCSASALAKEVTGGLWDDFAEAARTANNDTVGAMTRFCRSINTSRGVAAVLTLARSEPGVPILPEALDSHPWLLNVENGTLNLKSGKLHPHRREDLLTKLAPVVFDAEATAPNWENFLYGIFAGDRELVEFVQRWAGFSSTGSTRDHVLPFLYGTGANGKSVLLNTLLAILGPDYSMKAPPDLLMAKRGQSHPTELADLFGMRLVACIEAEDGKRLAESLVKEITGGDSIRARRMREDFWQFEPTHKIVLAANHKPEVRGTDHGIWRRLTLIPFAVRFWQASRGETGPPELEADAALPEKLLAERSGILNWLVAGCLEWQRIGLAAPEVVLHCTDEYRAEQDIAARFIAERCIEHHEVRAQASDLYGEYREWCESTGEKPLSQRRFGSLLNERSYERYTAAGKRWYRGIAIAANVDHVDL